MSLTQSILTGNRLALARLLSQVENDTPEGHNALSELFPRTGHAHLIGVTGAPGTGKSSLVNVLARYYRQTSDGSQPPRVGIVAVDPSSPFTGGAILGDRVRMRDLAGDPGVFIRSMATRGSLGGLASATSGVVQALDAAGFDIILIETVGAGQAEVDIARLAHTTLVVEAPGLGDDIQAIKAGIMEIADILVINKADRPGVETTERALRSILQLAHPMPHIFADSASHHQISTSVKDPSVPVLQVWLPPILRTIAIEGTGVPELAKAIANHRQHLVQTGELQQRERLRLKAELDLLLREALLSRWRQTVSDEHYDQVLENLVQRQISPWQAIESLLGDSV